MIEIEKPRIDCIETPTDDSYGKYVIEPLERGYGPTLGNSLRRCLLYTSRCVSETGDRQGGYNRDRQGGYNRGPRPAGQGAPRTENKEGGSN